ncbi:MAG: SMI1/KNR4 family protein [Actinomycetia bacterium]|nr:SMI1/KNR4 family protein [Actinomycetes bacterium]
MSGLTEIATFADPATEEQVEAAERALDGELPRPLLELLYETNGVADEYGLGLIWPLDRIVDDNLMFRTNPLFRDLYMPFDPLLFFADAGNGDQFAFPWTPRSDEIYAWDHEDDSRRWVAGSLDQYLQWWLDGTLRL